MISKLVCLNCEEDLKGRKGKKFCSDYCRSNFHYQRNKEKTSSRFKIIDKQLKLNRRLLQQFNKAGKSTVRAEKLLETGFNPNYFTNYWKNKKGDVYLFCYEYGFLKKIESFDWAQGNKKVKYILVEWQEYMKR